MAEQNARLVYVGTYTRGDSEGIYVCRLDRASGRLAVVDTASGIRNPSFLALHPSRRYLYAVSEVSDSDGRPTGGVSAFAINPESGSLTLLNQQESGGTGPCHVSVEKTGRYVLVANYAGGSVAVLPIGEDGTLGEASGFIQHEGASGANPDRQDRPHAHSINVDPANRRAYVADLGLDRVMVYDLDLQNGTLAPSDPPWTQIHAGAGPRHFAFHPDGRHAYVINELDSTLTVLAYEPGTGALTVGQTVSTLPDGFTGRNTTGTDPGSHLRHSPSRRARCRMPRRNNWTRGLATPKIC
jgi:6-phosphogluconolactonase